MAIPDQPCVKSPRFNPSALTAASGRTRYRQTNIIDAWLRVLIGAISAAVLFLLLDSGALVDVQIGAAKIAGTSPSWQATLLVGFAAGFLERLVPDLLAKAAPPQGRTTTPAPAPVPTSP